MSGAVLAGVPFLGEAAVAQCLAAVSRSVPQCPAPRIAAGGMRGGHLGVTKTRELYTVVPDGTATSPQRVATHRKRLRGLACTTICAVDLKAKVRFCAAAESRRSPSNACANAARCASPSARALPHCCSCTPSEIIAHVRAPRAACDFQDFSSRTPTVVEASANISSRGSLQLALERLHAQRRSSRRCVCHRRRQRRRHLSAIPLPASPPAPPAC